MGDKWEMARLGLLSHDGPMQKSKHMVLTSLALLLTGLSAGAGPATHPPNIVFIFSDDHSIQTIGACNARLSQFCREQNITPNLDRLAASGGLFVNSFCGNSLCSPSRASVLTGLHSHSNGVETLDQPLKPGLWTYPRSLREAGYQTAFIGKWHLAGTIPEFAYWRILPGQGDYLDPAFIGPDGREKHTGYVTDIITDMALDWLKKRDPSKSFFLAIQHKAPHRNWIPPLRYANWLNDITVPEPTTLFDDYNNRASPARLQQMNVGKDMILGHDLKIGTNYASNPLYAARNVDYLAKHPTGDDLVRWKYQEYVKDYLRCVKAVDDSVGRVMDALNAAGLETNTVVIYSSDQGFYMGEHGWFDKRWIYEESIHMPFIIRWPGVVKSGTRFTPFIQNIDYAPTFVEMAGGKIPDGLHGKSIVPILRGETPAGWRDSVYYHYYDKNGAHNVANHYGVRTGRYTLAYYYATDEWELFDNEKDPQQMRSVYADPKYATTVTELKGELTRLRALYGDTNEPPDALLHAPAGTQK
jgi:arylsulfatase A-like enzyme